MYAGPSGKVVLNPDPEDTNGGDWESIVVEMKEIAIQQPVRQHVRNLATALGRADDQTLADSENSWLRRISQYGFFSEEDEALLSDLSVIARAAEEADTTWIVMLLPENGWGELFNDSRMWMRRWLPWWW